MDTATFNMCIYIHVLCRFHQAEYVIVFVWLSPRNV